MTDTALSPIAPNNSDTSPILTHASNAPPPYGPLTDNPHTSPSHMSKPYKLYRHEIEVNRSCSFMIMCSSQL